MQVHEIWHVNVSLSTIFIQTETLYQQLLNRWKLELEHIHCPPRMNLIVFGDPHLSFSATRQ